MPFVQKEQAFLTLCRELDIKTQKLKNDDMNRLIGQLVGISVKCSIPAEKAPENCRLPETLIFSGMDSDSLDRFLDAYKAKKLQPVSLKAVVTPSNITMTLYQLLRELQEHSRIMK